MGSRLYVEVLDYAPTTLTHREKLFLAVLADDARDTTRITWSSVESPKTLRRAKVTRPQVYELIKALIKKGCLERVSAGQKNGTAKYRLLALQCPKIPDVDDEDQCPDSADTDDSQSPETPDTDADPQCQGIPDTDQSQCPDSADTEPDSQCPENPDTDESQCPEIPDVSVRKTRTPTHSPLSTRPLSPDEPPSSPAPQAAPEDVVDGEVIEESAEPEPVTAQTIVGEWLERCTDRPPSRVIGQMSREIRVLLDEDRIHPDTIRRGIALWMTKRLHPSTLASVVNEVMNATASTPQRPGRTQPNGDLFARAKARAAARKEGATQ